MEASDDWQIGKNLKDRLYYMFQNELMCDVKLLVGSDETVIHVHKLMLASASPVFYCMFNGPMAETGDVKIPDIETNIFQEILKFIYTDQADISFGNIREVVYGAEKYMLLNMKEMCGRYLTENINKDQACKVLQISHDFNLKKTEGDSLKCILENGISCLQSETLSFLSTDCLKLVIGSDDLNCNEENVYNITVKWGQYKCKANEMPVTDENIRKELGDLLYFVRFPNIDRSHFTEAISNRSILTYEEIIKVYQSYDKKYDHSIFSNTPRRLKEEILPTDCCNMSQNILFEDKFYENCLDFRMRIDSPNFL